MSRGRVLEQVAGGAGLYRGQDVGVAVVGGEHQDPDPGQVRGQLPDRGQPARAGHAQVHQHHIRLLLPGRHHGLLARAGLGDDRQPRLSAQQRPQAGAHYRMIIRNEDPHGAGPRREIQGVHAAPAWPGSPGPAGTAGPGTGTTTLTVVPQPGELRTWSRPPASSARARMPGRP